MALGGAERPWRTVSSSYRYNPAMRFSLRTALIGMALLAALCTAVNWVLGIYYIQLRRVNAVVAEYPEIERVWLSTNDDVTLEVEVIYFTTNDAPGITLEVAGTDGASKAELRRGIERALRERQPVALPDWAVDARVVTREMW